LRSLANRDLADPEGEKVRLCADQESTASNAMHIDFTMYLPDDILVKVDRASMLASLEVRAPWLDHRIVEFAFEKLPDQLRVTEKERKVLPRLLAGRLLPKKLNLNRKQGFSIPLRHWLRGMVGEYVADILADASREIFDRGVIRRMLSAQKHGMVNAERLFGLTLFELWRREYKAYLS
jgi:asparagine synthase (glutamine-hydrolysing)